MFKSIIDRLLKSNLSNTFPKLKSCQAYLQLYTLANLKVVNTNLKLIYKDFISKH